MLASLVKVVLILLHIWQITYSCTYFLSKFYTFLSKNLPFNMSDLFSTILPSVPNSTKKNLAAWSIERFIESITSAKLTQSVLLVPILATSGCFILICPVFSYGPLLPPPRISPYNLPSISSYF